MREKETDKAIAEEAEKQKEEEPHNHAIEYNEQGGGL